MSHPELILDLSKRYCEPHRFYHTLGHIAYILMMGRDLELSDEQTLAIWFHDAIFEPRSSTNEIDSANLAVEILRASNYPEASVELVRRMVLDSEKHTPTIPESAKVIDLDLCPLAAESSLYDSNRENIRRENLWLSDAEFDENLGKFAESFLARERIFWTPWGEFLEAAARANLQRTLDGLRSR